MDIHVVKSGDSLYAIAQAYSVSMSLLLRENQLSDPSRLVVGQTIVVRYPKVTHTVTMPQTLEQIAENYGTTVKGILRNNPQLAGWEELYIGQQLVIFYQEEGDVPIYSTAYAYPSIDQGLLHQTLPYLTTVTPFTHRFDQEGNLISLNDGYIRWASDKLQVGTVFHLASIDPTGAFSTVLSNGILGDVSLQEKLIAQIMTEVEEKDYVSVDIDFELIDPSYATAYVDFLARLKEKMGDMLLTVAVAPKISAEQEGLFHGGHLYPDIGRVCDRVLLMTYEWGYPQGEPMAIAPITGVRQVLDYAVREISPEKLLLGIPTYGYDWKMPKVMGVNAVSVTCPNAVELARDYGAEIFYDETQQAPYFHYTDDKKEKHFVWFEDARSIQSKLSLLSEYGLGGVGYWNLDRPFAQNWSVLSALCHINSCDKMNNR